MTERQSQVGEDLVAERQLVVGLVAAPGLPFSLVFRAEPGREDIALKIASAYEAASRRRIPPPAFGPLVV